MDHSRDPCPWVALSDFGGAFCMGVSTVYRLLAAGHVTWRASELTTYTGHWGCSMAWGEGLPVCRLDSCCMVGRR